MNEDTRRKDSPSFEEYADAIRKILHLIDIINQLSQYYDLNQISIEHLDTTFTRISPQKVANYFGVQYSRTPSLVQQTQYNPVALVTKASQIAQQIQPEVLNSLTTMYGVEPEIVKSLKVYVQLAQVLPKIISSQSVPASINTYQQYNDLPGVMKNY